MDRQTRQRIAAVRHLSVLADALEQGKVVQFLFAGSRRVTGEKVDGWGDTDSFPGNLDDDVLTHWRVKPAKKYRAWGAGEAPKYFIARRDGEVAAHAYAAQPDGHALRHGPGSFYVRVDLLALFECAVRVLEDGSEVPCGVEVAE